MAQIGAPVVEELAVVEVPAGRPSIALPITGLASGVALYGGGCRVTGGVFVVSTATMTWRLFDGANANALEVIVLTGTTGQLVQLVTPSYGIKIASALWYTFTGTGSIEGAFYVEPHLGAW